jgi:DNA polymerase-4
MQLMSTLSLPPDAITWLFLDMNSFFASVEQQECASYAGKPLIVVPSMTDATCAIAASYEAKAYGIKTGTNVGQAKDKCPNLICVPARHDIYLKYHQMMLDCVAAYTPITKTCSIDELASKLAPSRCNAPKAIEIARNIKAKMYNEMGASVTCSIGLSSNIFLAKMASDLQKPDGLTLLPPRDAHKRLSKLQLTDLTGIGLNMERRLNKCGIWTVDQLWQCSPKQMRQIWKNVEGEKFWYKMRGYDIPDLPTSASVIGHSRVLEPAFREPDQAKIVLSQLTEKACNRMRRKGFAAKLMTISVREVLGNRYSTEVSYSPPCSDNIRCVREVSKLYDALNLKYRLKRLKKVSVTFTKLIEIEKIHPDLFHDYAEQASSAETLQTPFKSRPPSSTAQDTINMHHLPSQAQTAHNGVYHRPFFQKYQSASSASSLEQRKRHANLSHSIDHIIKKFGSDSIHFGCTPEAKSKYVGTKIAFNRIPDQEEFW